jgi:hypothetical protein
MIFLCYVLYDIFVLRIVSYFCVTYCMIFMCYVLYDIYCLLSIIYWLLCDLFDV